MLARAEFISSARAIAIATDPASDVARPAAAANVRRESAVEVEKVGGVVPAGIVVVPAGHIQAHAHTLDLVAWPVAPNPQAPEVATSGGGRGGGGGSVRRAQGTYALAATTAATGTATATGADARAHPSFHRMRRHLIDLAWPSATTDGRVVRTVASVSVSIRLRRLGLCAGCRASIPRRHVPRSQDRRRMLAGRFAPPLRRHERLRRHDGGHIRLGRAAARPRRTTVRGHELDLRGGR